MILVTGCAGFIGSNLCESLLKEDERIVGIDNFDPYYKISIKKKNIAALGYHKKFRFFQIDIKSAVKLRWLFDNFSFSHIIHLAASPGVGRSLKEPLPYIKNNIWGLINLLEHCKESKTPFIFSSSSSVYADSGKIPFAEKDYSGNPLSPYGASKKSGEIYCRLYHDLYNIPVIILRLFTVFGPKVRPDMAVFKFIDNILKGREITLYDKGEVARDYTYIDDVVLGIKKSLAGNLNFEIINLGCGNPIKIKKLVSIIEKKIGKKAKIRYVKLPQAEMSRTYADNQKASKILNWKPKTAIGEGLDQLIKWYHENY